MILMHLSEKKNVGDEKKKKLNLRRVPNELVNILTNRESLTHS